LEADFESHILLLVFEISGPEAGSCERRGKKELERPLSSAENAESKGI